MANLTIICWTPEFQWWLSWPQYPSELGLSGGCCDECDSEDWYYLQNDWLDWWEEIYEGKVW